MSLRLIKPGMRHPKTGVPLRPIGFLKSGKAVWPVLGASPDDPDDPKYGEDEDEGDDEGDNSSDEGDDEDKPEEKPKEEDDKESSRPERQAAKYRVKLREAEAREKALAERLRKLEDAGKPADELASRDLTEARTRAEKAEEAARSLRLENAFFKANTINWEDPADALRLADLSDVDVDEDGMVDIKGLSAVLKDLAKRKPHLVKKSQAGGQDDQEQSSGRQMNGTRRGGKQEKANTREQLAKTFPVLNRI